MTIHKSHSRWPWQKTLEIGRFLANALLPPFLANLLRRMKRPPIPALEFLPRGWDSVPSSETSANGWDVESTVSGTACERAQFERGLENGAPLGIAHEHNLHVSFAYVLSVVSRGKSTISVLDWGAGLGQYFHVAKAALPGIEIEYHCKEVAVLAKAGRQRAAEATWHTDDSCLAASYDLVFASGSPQYAKDWEALLAKLAAASRDYLFLTRIPVVLNTPNFAVLQRVYGSRMVFWVFRQSDFLDVVRRQGFELIREFLVQDWPPIHDAPEPCELRGWLFRRTTRR